MSVNQFFAVVAILIFVQLRYPELQGHFILFLIFFWSGVAACMRHALEK